MPRLFRRLGLALVWTTVAVALIVTTLLALNTQASAQVKPPPRDPQIGRSFQVPYRLTDTNHFLVRVRINGKGPFNFLVDSGAPALFIATETAKRVGLKPAQTAFWTPIDHLDFEGGATLSGIKARVEDPFQLVGMNALGLPGASIDGILGFTILARYRLEIDPTDDRMTWTRLDHEPRDPPVPDQKPGDNARAPLGVQAMSALGPLAKGLAFLMGKQPEEERNPRGFLGLEWSELTQDGQTHVQVVSVLKGSPASSTLQAGDRILRIKDRLIDGKKAARAALAEVRPGNTVPLVILRGSGADAHQLTLTLTAGEGL